VTTLYNVQLAEMDLAHAARDFSDAVEVSLRCSEAHENLGASNAAVVGEKDGLTEILSESMAMLFREITNLAMDEITKLHKPI